MSLEHKVGSLEMLFHVFNHCHTKLIENSHKSNPFDLTFDRIEERIIEEKIEFIEAYHAWVENPTFKNLEAMQREIADIVNFYAIFSGKAEGFTKLERR